MKYMGWFYLSFMTHFSKPLGRERGKGRGGGLFLSVKVRHSNQRLHHSGSWFCYKALTDGKSPRKPSSFVIADTVVVWPKPHGVHLGPVDG